MQTWKIWDIAGAKFARDYQVEAGPDYGQQPPAYNPPKAEHLMVPNGIDPNGVIRTETAQKAKGAYEGVNYTASVAGVAGNGISLAPDGVKDIDTLVDAWNASNAGNEVTHDGTGTNVPASGTISLDGGTAAGPQLIADATALLDHKKQENVKARESKISVEQSTAETAIKGELDKKSKTTQLMVAVNNVFEYLKALQTEAAIADVDMTQAGQDAKTALANMQTNMMGPILTHQGVRDAAIADTASYYPNPSDGLPAGYEDDYTP